MVDLLAGVFEDLETDGCEPGGPPTSRWAGEQVRWQAFGDTLAADDPVCAARILEMESDRVMRSVGRQRGAFASFFTTDDPPERSLIGDLPRQLGVRTGPIGGRVLYELGVDGAFVLHARGAAARLASLAVGLIEGLIASSGCEAVVRVEQQLDDAVAIRVTPAPASFRARTPAIVGGLGPLQSPHDPRGPNR